MTLDQFEKGEKIALFHLESMRRNIAEIRTWIFQLTIMSGGIIGFTIPVFGKSHLIKNSLFLILGLFFLWAGIVLGFGYLKMRLEKENNNLSEQMEKMIKNSEIKPQVKDNTKKTPFLNFLDKHILTILYTIFIFATLLIIISMINF